MCVDWIAYILLYINWNWLNYMLLLRNDGLEVNMINCLRLNDLLKIDCYVNCYWEVVNWKWSWMTCFGIWLICVVIENDVIVEDVELRNEILNDVDDERMSWAIEIVELRFVELDWIDEFIMKLIVICVCICIFDGVGGQALEGDRGKQPETSNK